MTTVKDSLMTETEFESWERGDTVQIGEYTIKPKRDFGQHGFLIKGVMVKAGWVVVKDHALATPGGLWDTTKAEATRTVGILMASKGDVEVFYGLNIAIRPTQ